MALVRSDLDFKLKSVNADNEGRYLIIEAEVQSSAFLLVSIYAPNKVQEQCDFFGNVNKTGGDFNVVLDTDLDCSGGNPSKNDSTKISATYA